VSFAERAGRDLVWFHQPGQICEDKLDESKASAALVFGRSRNSPDPHLHRDSDRIELK
jgi:hypothetical protein